GCLALAGSAWSGFAGTRMVESASENSVWTWRWTKPDMRRSGDRGGRGATRLDAGPPAGSVRGRRDVRQVRGGAGSGMMAPFDPNGMELSVSQLDLKPIAPGERNLLLDALRGTALLGILLMNMEAFNGPVLASGTGVDPQLSGIDRAVDALVYFFVQGKFFTLFSLLFGMGFLVMSSRSGAAGWLFAGTFLRRMAVLLCIGLAHGLLVWSGDILVSYALLGVPLLLVRQAPPRWLAIPGVLVFLAGPGMILLFGLL